MAIRLLVKPRGPMAGFAVSPPESRTEGGRRQGREG